MPLNPAIKPNVDCANLHVSQAGKPKKEKKSNGQAATPAKPEPEFIKSRLLLWDQLRKKHDDEMGRKAHLPINVTLPDGKVIPATAWQTTPYDVAKGISSGLAESTVIAKVNGDLWDLERPLEIDSRVQLIKFDDPEGQAVFWHSSAHVLGEAMEHIYCGHLCYGPPIENGFYYDMYHEGDGVS